jgi:hypothetical protein
MANPNSIEFEFDLLALDGDNAIENFKNLFGKKLKELGLNYEIFNLSDPKMTGGGKAIDSGSSSTYPYNMFENFMDTIFKKKHDIKAESSSIYDMLFRDFKGHAEEDYAKKMFEVTSAENGYYINTAEESKKILDKSLPSVDEANAAPKVENALSVPPVLNKEGVFSYIQNSISNLSDPLKLSTPDNTNQLAEPKEEVGMDDTHSVDHKDSYDDVESDVESELSVKKRNKIITLKLVIQYKDALSLEGIKKG